MDILISICPGVIGMFLFIFLSLPFLIRATATNSASVEVKVPQQLELVDVLFFQAFLLVPSLDKVADLRKMLTEALSKKLTLKDFDHSEYSDMRLFEKSISIGFERYSCLGNMGISKFTKQPQETSVYNYYMDYLYEFMADYVLTSENPKKTFQMANFLMEDSLFTYHVLDSINKPKNQVLNLAVDLISNSYSKTQKSVSTIKRSSKYPKDASTFPIPFELSSPKLSMIPLPIPGLSLKIFSNLLLNDETFTKMEKYYAESWGKYVGQRASLVDKMIVEEKMPEFVKGLKTIIGTSKNSPVLCAADLALAKAYNITGYIPFPNYRSSNELYLNTILQARMLLKFPELRQANVQSLAMSVEKSINATQSFLDTLPSVPSRVLSFKLNDYRSLLRRVPIIKTYQFSDYDYWKEALSTGFPKEILPPAQKRFHSHKRIIDCYTVQTCIASLVYEYASLKPLDEMLLPPKSPFCKSYYNLSQLYIKSAIACQKDCTQYSPFLSRSDGRPLNTSELVLFEMTIAQAMHFKKLPCLAPRIYYLEALLDYLHEYKLIDFQIMKYALDQIHLIKAS